MIQEIKELISNLNLQEVEELTRVLRERKQLLLRREALAKQLYPQSK